MYISPQDLHDLFIQVCVIASIAIAVAMVSTHVICQLIDLGFKKIKDKLQERRHAEAGLVERYCDHCGLLYKNINENEKEGV